MKSDLIDLTMHLLHETPGAIRVTDGTPDEDVWLPRSQIETAPAPAALRFVSCEPLLGKLHLDQIDYLTEDEFGKFPTFLDALTGRVCIGDFADQELDSGHQLDPGIDWVIVGGESGPGARPMHPDWVVFLIEQCRDAGTPVFFKQWGDWISEVDRDRDDPDWREDYTRADRTPDKYRILNAAGGHGFHGYHVHLMVRVGKRAAGHRVNGTEYREWPRE